MVCGGHRHLGGSEARTLPERSIPRGKKRPRLAASTSAATEAVRPAPQSPESKPDKKTGGIIQGARDKAGQVLQAVTGHTGKGAEAHIPKGPGKPQEAEVITLAPQKALTNPQKQTIKRGLSNEIREEVEANNGGVLPEAAVNALKRKARTEFADGANFTESDEKWLDEYVISAILEEVENQKPVAPLTRKQKTKLVTKMKELILADIRERRRGPEAGELFGVEGALTHCGIGEITEVDKLWLDQQSTEISRAIMDEGEILKSSINGRKKKQIEKATRESMQLKLKTLKRPLSERELQLHLEAMLGRHQLQREQLKTKEIEWLRRTIEEAHTSLSKDLAPQQPKQVTSATREDVRATVVQPSKPEPAPKAEPPRQHRAPAPTPKRQPQREAPTLPPEPQQSQAEPSQPSTSAKEDYFARLQADLKRGKAARQARQNGLQATQESQEGLPPALAALKQIKQEEPRHRGKQSSQKAARRKWQARSLNFIGARMNYFPSGRNSEEKRIDLRRKLIEEFGAEAVIEHAPDFLGS